MCVCVPPRICHCLQLGRARNHCFQPIICALVEKLTQFTKTNSECGNLGLSRLYSSGSAKSPKSVLGRPRPCAPPGAPHNSSSPDIARYCALGTIGFISLLISQHVSTLSTLAELRHVPEQFKPQGLRTHDINAAYRKPNMAQVAAQPAMHMHSHKQMKRCGKA